jgi:uncharacterized protein YoxC
MIYVEIAGAIALLALAVLIGSFVPAALRVGKLLDKLETTVDEINSEMSKVNEATDSIQKAVSRIDNISSLVEQTVSSPLIKVAGYGAGITGALRGFARGRAAKK